MDPAEVLDVRADNVAEMGFFCYMSKRKSPGYGRKFDWVRSRFAEGLRIKMLRLPERGFIEYIPGEFAWRPVYAEGYMVIHCLWIVGRSRGKGHARRLIGECLDDARGAGMDGVAAVTSEGNWLVGRRPFEAMGFECVDQAPPTFCLMVKRFRQTATPRFTGGWQQKLARCGPGLTVFRSGQCPYLEDATRAIVETGAAAGWPTQVVELRTARDVREKCPSAYGVYTAVHDGRLLAYHSIGRNEILKRLPSKL
jgi:GNAT superfamily N-acetyltransferase